MKKPKKFNFLEWNNNALVSSLKKIDLNIATIIILDSLFYVLSYYFFIFWQQIIRTKMAAINLPADLVSLGYERTQQALSETRTFYYVLIFSAILFLIAVILLASILKGIIWAKTTNTKLTFSLISKFLGLNLMWMGFWFVLVILISWLVVPTSAATFMIITVILGLYFTNTLYTVFMKKQRLNSIKAAVKLGITKIHLLAFPYFAILLLLLIIIKLGNLLTFKYSAILFGLIMVAYVAFIRYYISTLVLEIEELK